jgi:hypothetical protein
MKEFLSSLTQQAPLPGAQEGLPYWIFWFLLSIILLLVFFIFLRDKDLRRRINLFFFGTKQKLIKIRLQHRLKRELRKKEELIRDMGKTVWEKKMELGGVASLFEALEALETDQHQSARKIEEISETMVGVNEAQASASRNTESRMEERLAAKTEIEGRRISLEKQRKGILEQIQTIKKNIRAIEKELKDHEKSLPHPRGNRHTGEGEGEEKRPGFARSLEDLTQKRSEAEKQAADLGRQKNKILANEKSVHKEMVENDKAIAALTREDREKKHHSAMEIKDLDRERERHQDKIQELVRRTLPLYHELGKLADGQRPKQLDLVFYYSQLDRTKSRIEDLRDQIKNLS